MFLFNILLIISIIYTVLFIFDAYKILFVVLAIKKSHTKLIKIIKGGKHFITKCEDIRAKCQTTHNIKLWFVIEL